MCGFIGGFGGNNKEKNFISFSKEIRHRGPDQEIEFKDGNFFLKFYRLAINNIKNKSTQPILHDQNVFIFNGEIYNYKELLKNLNIETDNKTFDGTVIPFLYEKYGNSLFKEINGMFSMVIYDKKKHKIILARDRFGEKPLYYFLNNKFLFFSSEISPLQKTINTKLNYLNLAKYFAYGFIPSPNTLYENIYKIEPGSYLEINLNNFSKRSKAYFDFSYGEKKFTEKSKLELIDLLERSYKLRTQNEVKQSILLSSGLDSNIIKYFDAKNKINTDLFSLGYNEETFDETTHLKNIYSHNEKLNLFIPNNKEFIDSFFQVYEKLDDIIYDQSIVPTFLINKFLKNKGVKVSLSGEGIDELLYGYMTLDALKYGKLTQKFFKKSILNKVFLFSKKFEYPKTYISKTQKFNLFFKGVIENEKYWQPSWLSPFSVNEINQLTDSSFKKEDIFSEMEVYDDRKKFSNSYISYSHFYLRYYLCDNLLVKSDRASMLNSIENRCVFLDKNLTDFLMQFDRNANISEFKNKNTLREVFKDKLDSSIITKKKHGFGLPIHNILSNGSFIERIKNKKFYREKMKSKIVDNDRKKWGVCVASGFIK